MKTNDPYPPPNHAEEAAAGGEPVTSALPEHFSDEIERLYDRHFTPLVKWLHTQFGAGPPEPEDVAQRAFVNLAKRGSLQGIKSPKAFLWRSARNIFVSDKRSQSVHSKSIPSLEALFSRPEGDIFDPNRVLLAKEVLDIMTGVIERMPMRRRRAFILRRIEGLTYAEITKRLGMTRSNAAKHVVKATQDIMDACQQIEEFEFSDEGNED